jgi:hypothetical protein
MGVIYLIKTREFVNSEQNIFKIGKSSKPGANRTSQYPNGSILYFLITVSNENLIEHKIIEIFSKEFIRKKEYGNEYFEGEYNEMIEKIIVIIKNCPTDTLEYGNDCFEEQSICKLKKSYKKIYCKYRTHYIEFKDGTKFLCETSNGFIQKLIDKSIIEVDKDFDILDPKLIDKINKEKSKLYIEHFDIFCSVYKVDTLPDNTECLFNDTIINDTFCGLNMDTFKKSKFKNFEKREFYINIDKEQVKDRYGAYDSICDGYANITIYCINNKLFSANLFFRFIPKTITIYNDCYIFEGREYNYINLDSIQILEQEGEYIHLYESGKTRPWESEKTYYEYKKKIDEINTMYSLDSKKCLNPDMDIFHTFIHL